MELIFGIFFYCLVTVATISFIMWVFFTAFEESEQALEMLVFFLLSGLSATIIGFGTNSLCSKIPVSELEKPGYCDFIGY